MAREARLVAQVPVAEGAEEADSSDFVRSELDVQRGGLVLPRLLPDPGEPVPQLRRRGRGSHAVDGAAYLLVQDQTFPRSLQSPLPRIISIFSQAILHYDIRNHKQALTDYLNVYRLHPADKGNQQLTVNCGANEVLVAAFDESNRLTKLELRLQKSESSVI